jgi:MtN3 and saliva related transmembrane protein
MDQYYTIIIGYIAGFLTTICLFPQLVKIIKTKSSNDVSIPTFIILLLGQIFWILYGFNMNDLRIIITNVISGILCFLILLASVIFNK